MADFYSARDSKGYRLRLNTWIHEQSIANNTTVVGYSVLMERNGNYSFATSGNRVTCTINGTQVVNTTVSADMTSAKSVTLAWGYTSAITHNADGTKSVSCSASFTPSSSAYYMPTSKTASGTYTLTTIPRASTVTVKDTNIGSSATINIARNLSSYTDTLTYSFSDLTGTIATKTSNTSVSWTVPTSFYAKIPNASSGVCTITCETFNGNTSLGTKTTTFNVLVDPDTNKPTVSGTIATTDSLSNTLTGGTSTIIRYVSNVQATITATGKNSATIASKLIKCDDGQQLTASGTMNKVGSGTFTFSAVDSRGLTNSATVTKTLINYVPLTITGDAKRPSPTSTTINVNLSGNYFNGSFGSQSNTLTIQYRTKLTSSSTWSSWTTLSGATTSGNTYTLSSKSIGTSYTYRNSYDVEVVAKDKVNTGTTVIFRKTVPSGTPVYWWNNNKFVHNTNVELQDGSVLDTVLTNLLKTQCYMVAANTSAEQTLSTQGSVITCNLSSAVISNGSYLTFNSTNKGIVIGSGVSHVEISGQIYITSKGTNGLKNVYIYQNNNSVARSLIYINYDYQTISIPPHIIAVSSGDVITLRASSNNGTTTKLAYSTTGDTTRLVVRVID